MINNPPPPEKRPSLRGCNILVLKFHPQPISKGHRVWNGSVGFANFRNGGNLLTTRDNFSWEKPTNENRLTCSPPTTDSKEKPVSGLTILRMRKEGFRVCTKSCLHCNCWRTWKVLQIQEGMGWKKNLIPRFLKCASLRCQFVEERAKFVLSLILCLRLEDFQFPHGMQTNHPQMRACNLIVCVLWKNQATVPNLIPFIVWSWGGRGTRSIPDQIKMQACSSLEEIPIGWYSD